LLDIDWLCLERPHLVHKVGLVTVDQPLDIVELRLLHVAHILDQLLSEISLASDDKDGQQDDVRDENEKTCAQCDQEQALLVLVS